jgi:hypothetical protein
MDEKFIKIYLDNENDIYLVNSLVINSVCGIPCNKILMIYSSISNGKSTFINELCCTDGIKACYGLIENILHDVTLETIINDGYNLVVINNAEINNLNYAQIERLKYIIQHKNIFIRKHINEAPTLQTAKFNILVETNDNNSLEKLDEFVDIIEFTKTF